MLGVPRHSLVKRYFQNHAGWYTPFVCKCEGIEKSLSHFRFGQGDTNENLEILEMQQVLILGILSLLAGHSIGLVCYTCSVSDSQWHPNLWIHLTVTSRVKMGSAQAPRIQARRLPAPQWVCLQFSFSLIILKKMFINISNCK